MRKNSIDIKFCLYFLNRLLFSHNAILTLLNITYQSYFIAHKRQKNCLAGETVLTIYAAGINVAPACAVKVATNLRYATATPDKITALT